MLLLKKMKPPIKCHSHQLWTVRPGLNVKQGSSFEQVNIYIGIIKIIVIKHSIFCDMYFIQKRGKSGTLIKPLIHDNTYKHNQENLNSMILDTTERLQIEIDKKNIRMLWKSSVRGCINKHDVMMIPNMLQSTSNHFQICPKNTLT